MPVSIQTRIEPQVIHTYTTSFFAITLSVLIGAITHIAWDSLAHAKSPWAVLRPFLDRELFAVGTYQVFVFRVLQHASTLLGLVFIAWWIMRWYKNAVAIYPVTVPSPSRSRIAATFALTSLVALSVGGVMGLSAVGSRHGVLALQHFSVKTIVTAVPVYGLVFFGYCFWWHRQTKKMKSYEKSKLNHKPMRSLLLPANRCLVIK